MNKTVLFLLAFTAACAVGVSAQTKEEIKQQAESRLSTMTPEQIDAKLKELGMTREEAEAKAKEYGVDLNTYFQMKGSQQGATQPAAKLTPKPHVKDTTAAAPAYEAPKPIVPAPQPGVLPYFGYDVFTQPPAAFEPAAAGPVDPEYVIGPEDVIRVTVWGQVEMQQELAVDKEGKVFLPTIGQFIVSGLTLEQATEKMKKQMSRSYSGLTSQPPTIWLDVAIASLRPKRVFVMGEVKVPGGYTVSSYATVFNVLYSVGGPTVKGSLRDVRVLRNGKVLAHVDLYDYLTGAEKTNDFRVQNNDIIFVPVRGRTVSIGKEVKKPAIYELKGTEQFRSLLGFAGGPLSTAYAGRIQIDRVLPFNERKDKEMERRIEDVDFNAILNGTSDVVLSDGDSISVFSIVDELRNAVWVSGSVWRPGMFQLEKAPSVRKAVAMAGGLRERAFKDEAHILRYNADQLTRMIIPFSLRNVMAEGGADLQLAARDSVVIFSTEETEFKDRYVIIRGEVKHPGRYFLPDNMSLRELILEAGGYTDNAEMLQAEVARVRRTGLGGDTLAIVLHPDVPRTFTVNEGEAFGSAAFPLEHRDEVYIRANPRFRPQQNVYVFGDVMYPGVYTLRERVERLSDILRRAGGKTTSSFLEGGVFKRDGKRVAVDFAKAYEGDEEQDVVMQTNDSITVPSKPRTVLVTGEVNRPGLFTYIDGDKVCDYVDYAGGTTDSANYAIYTKPTGESRRVNFGFLRTNPMVLEGSTIEVTKIQQEPPGGQRVDIAATIKDMFAILTSAATVAFLIWQTTK